MTYIALLRGINVGGKNKVDMKELKKCLENAGLQKIQTYINSGNVIFQSSLENTRELADLCEKSIEKHFGFFIAVAVLSKDELEASLKAAPPWWGGSPESKHNAIFVIEPASAEQIIQEAGEIKPDYEQLAFAGKLIFWSAPLDTFSRTRWSKIVGTNAYQKITIRNANTARKLAEMAKSRNPLGTPRGIPAL